MSALAQGVLFLQVEGLDITPGTAVTSESLKISFIKRGILHETDVGTAFDHPYMFLVLMLEGEGFFFGST